MLGVGMGLGVGVAEGLGDGVGVGVGVGVAVGETVGIGAGMETPVFQTNFLPLLIQVYFLPEDVEVAPSFEQVAPCLTTAMADIGVRNNPKAMHHVSSFFMCRCY